MYLFIYLFPRVCMAFFIDGLCVYVLVYSCGYVCISLGVSVCIS